MTDRAWQDMIVGERMAVDREFTDRVRASGLSQQEWSLVMTAVEFRVEGSGEDARLVADTSKVPHVLPEIGRMRSEMGPMAGGGRGGGRGGGSRGGLFSSIKSALGLGGGDGADEETVREAEELTAAYATELQRELEEKGKWEAVRDAATEQPSPG